MKIVRIFLAVLLGITLNAAAQQGGLPPVFKIHNDTGQTITLDNSYFQILPNASKTITFKDVLDAGSDRNFTTFQDHMSSRGKGIFWYRFRIGNNTGRDIILTFPGNSSRSDFYIKDAGGKWKEFATGYGVPYSQRDGIKRSVQVLFPLADGGVITVYKRMEWKDEGSSLKPSVAIYDPAIGASEENTANYYDTIQTSALFGFMIFAALFNFFFYYTVRERVYLFYAITLLTAAAYNISEVCFEFLFSESPAIGNAIGSLMVMTVIILVLQTMRLFLHTKKVFPVWDKFLVLFPFILIALVVVVKFVMPSDKFNAAINYAALFLMLFYVVGIIIMLIIYLRKKDKNARLLTIALIPFFTGVLASFGDRFEWVTIAGLIWAVGVISWSLFARFRGLMDENNRQALEKERLAREKEEERNTLIEQQNEMLEKQVAERTSELSRSLADLKQTQAQLIQSEKMASLGELTAGIAHEIQNPLNFVNNFSDVSIELLEEMDEELGKGDIEEAKAISDDIKQNLEKIAHHGRRADGIVKGMLQHSRASSGQKEPTDINALADEYLRLAYHGLRAKDKSFNAELITHFDENLSKVNIIPQDVGRVLLNLFTNAFYATQQKSKQFQSPSSDEMFKPTIILTTKDLGDSVEVRVKDNGTGIPEAIKDKILQPFFTTKPTGEGTGLGLSLSYDIVVKGHGGTIAIDSKEGEGSEFTITLPSVNT